MNYCPYCDEDTVIYLGIDDDGMGSICDWYECENCGAQFEDHCRDAGDGDEPDN